MAYGQETMLIVAAAFAARRSPPDPNSVRALVSLSLRCVILVRYLLDIEFTSPNSPPMPLPRTPSRPFRSSFLQYPNVCANIVGAMIELSQQQQAVILRMEPGTWYRTADLARGGLDSATTSRILCQLTEPGLVERELAQGGRLRYEYRLTGLGLRRRAQVKAPLRSLRPPRLEERLADWRRLGREVGRWLKEKLREFIP
jgi:DNA-binding HxlR family transcriptional regulator